MLLILRRPCRLTFGRTPMIWNFQKFKIYMFFHWCSTICIMTSIGKKKKLLQPHTLNIRLITASYRFCVNNKLISLQNNVKKICNPLIMSLNHKRLQCVSLTTYIIDTDDELYNDEFANTSHGANRSIFHTLFPSVTSGEYRILSNGEIKRHYMGNPIMWRNKRYLRSFPRYKSIFLQNTSCNYLTTCTLLPLDFSHMTTNQKSSKETRFSNAKHLHSILKRLEKK